MPTKVPGPKSAAEESFRLHLRADRAPAYKREYKFSENRKFRADFCWPDYKLIVEIDGLTREGGRHQRWEGYERDCTKQNLAQIEGFMYLRFSQNQVATGEAIQTTLLALSVREPIAKANREAREAEQAV